MIHKQCFPNNHVPVLVVRRKCVKSRCCLERSGDGKPTVLLTVATTVTVSQILTTGNLCRDSETRIWRDDTSSCSPCFAAALLPHSAVCYQQQHTLRESFDVNPLKNSTLGPISPDQDICIAGLGMHAILCIAIQKYDNPVSQHGVASYVTNLKAKASDFVQIQQLQSGCQYTVET